MGLTRPSAEDLQVSAAALDEAERAYRLMDDQASYSELRAVKEAYFTQRRDAMFATRRKLEAAPSQPDDEKLLKKLGLICIARQKDLEKPVETEREHLDLVLAEERAEMVYIVVLERWRWRLAQQQQERDAAAKRKKRK